MPPRFAQADDAVHGGGQPPGTLKSRVRTPVTAASLVVPSTWLDVTGGLQRLLTHRGSTALPARYDAHR